MKKRAILSIVILLIANMAVAQLGEQYAGLIDTAWKYYENKEYLKSAQTYSKAFASAGDLGEITDRYNAACSWARANNADSAFVQLFRIARSGYYTNYRHMSTDSDLLTLHDDRRWAEVTALVKINQEKKEANYDKPLVAMLDTIFQIDQIYRKQIGDIQKKYGNDSKEMQAHWKKIMTADSINLIKIKKILDERGWLGDSVIGNQGNQTLFLVIQHADQKTREQYLPMMREAVRIGNAEASALALLEDRVALGQGKRQIYGSQIGYDNSGAYVLPLDDPDHVDERRQAVGLGKLQEYVSGWGITWNVEEYKKKLPELEKKNIQIN
ncbi:DUF6624 domain-containing protein [Salmonirosea aquatica]|uniref:Uncharacterized protein n=1 Tax=Salmonirosea aquatica TaxID=2654236 RepID=A0A7C9F6Y4_9BACT|nr:hypothetical protein [Cytophagaceae bacterium SJW1-29]